MKNDLRILLAVPSKNRFRENQIQKDTMKWIIYTEYDWMIFVEHKEVKEYRKFTKNVVDIGENKWGLGYSKLKIQEYAIENGYDIIFSIDDDLSSIACPRDSSMNFSKRKVSIQERVEIKWDWMIRESLDAFKMFPNLGAVAVFEGGGKFKVKDLDIWMGVNKRLETCYMCRTELYCSPRCLEIPVFQDFSTYIFVRVSGYFTLLSGITGWHISHPVGQGDGGLQSFNRKELALRAKKVLSEMYPTLKWRDRPTKLWAIEPDFRRTKIQDLKLVL